MQIIHLRRDIDLQQPVKLQNPVKHSPDPAKYHLQQISLHQL